MHAAHARSNPGRRLVRSRHAVRATDVSFMYNGMVSCCILGGRGFWPSELRFRCRLNTIEVVRASNFDSEEGGGVWFCRGSQAAEWRIVLCTVVDAPRFVTGCCIISARMCYTVQKHTPSAHLVLNKRLAIVGSRSLVCGCAVAVLCQAGVHLWHRRAIAPQYIEQFRIVLSIFKVSDPTIRRDCPSMA